MECFTIDIQKYVYGTDFKMKIISNILKSTPIEISNKIIFENNVKCHIMQLDFITKRDIYIDIIDALDNLNEYENK